jgi:hypothetical protein
MPGHRHQHPVRPIFVVGSPRSGTSILTWSLGQHPNILPVEETAWIGKFALDLSSTHDLGSARLERSQLSASGITWDAFYEHFGRAINDLIVGHRARQEELRDALAAEYPDATNDRFLVSRDSQDPKSRWIDGTPEYSFYVHALLKLFPRAKFIHILRDVRDVVPSFVNLVKLSSVPIVGSEQEAYAYWLRAVTACVDAERAFGSGTVMRIRHSDLAASPEQTLRRCLDFLEEPFSADCLEPVQTTINSTRVTGAWQHEPTTDLDLVRQAAQLSDALLRDEEPWSEGDARVATRLADEFAERAMLAGRLESDLNTVLSVLRGIGIDPSEAILRPREVIARHAHQPWAGSVEEPAPRAVPEGDG